MTDIQTEKAFQKQEGVFLNSKKLSVKKTSEGVRFYKKIGLGKSHYAVRQGAFGLTGSANALTSFNALTLCSRLQDPQRSY